MACAIPNEPTVQAAPGGATDCHLHVFGPVSQFPYWPGHTYQPPLASEVEAAAVFAKLAITRAVLVQPSVYGTDNRCQVAAAAALPLPTRVVVAVDTNVSTTELATLHAAGARGVRLIADTSGNHSFADLESIANRIAPLGWHIELALPRGALCELASRLRSLPCPVVLDHFGMPDPHAGPDQPAFSALLNMLEAGNSWVKLSAANRVSLAPPPYHDLLPFVRALVSARPDRLVWGSDWPHAGPGEALSDTRLLFDLLPLWLPEEPVRSAVLTDNPTQLYGFETG